MKNNSNLDKNKNSKVIKKKKKEDDIEIYDKLYGFNINDKWDDLTIVNEFKKIDMNEVLKNKLLENRRHIIIILERNPKTKEDYRQLNLCRKRVIYIIRKIIENIKKENLTSKSAKNKLLLPKNEEDRKRLYIYLRLLEIRIKNELEKNNKIEPLISSKNEKEEEESDNHMDVLKFFSLFPFKDEYYKRLIFEDKQRIRREKLIYDNSYLYRDGNDNKEIEIRKEVYDILYEQNEEDEVKDEEENNRNGEIRIDIHPRKKGKFFVRRKKGLKKNTIRYNLKKIEDEEVEIVKKEETIPDDEKLERRIKNFYEKIKKLKAGNYDINNYDEELGQLMMEQIDKDIYEEDKIKELRVFNFFKNYITCRKNEMFGKNYLRKKFIYNSPVNFTFYPKMPKMKSVQLMNENV